MQSQDIPQVSVDDLATARLSGAVILDVRMPDEYEEAHVPGAQLIPLPELLERTSEIPECDTLFVICRSGARSLKACEALSAGGRSVANVVGGTMAWIESGRPTASGPERG